MSLAEVRSTFETLAKTDPLWTVLTLKRYKHNRWDPAEFFGTGSAEIQEVLDYVEGLGVEIRWGRALDFGCAVGRLSQPLGDRFAEVVGVDIAESFLDLVREYNRHGTRCRFVHNTRDDLTLFEDASFDFIYSNITLQHIPPEHSKKYMAEFFRLLRPGGIAVFQVPGGWTAFDGTASWCLRRLRWCTTAPLKRWWKQVRGQPLIGMYAVPREEVQRIVETSGARLVDVVANGAAGKGWTSYRYCAVQGNH